MIKKILLLTTIFVILFFVITSKNSKSYTNKVWAHKIDTINQLNAINDNINGVELDIFYDEKLDKFVISHYFPYDKNAENNLLFLERYLYNKKNLDYWLDFKNLHKLDTKQLYNSIKRLSFLAKKYNLPKETFMVESLFSPQNLQKYSKNGFRTILWRGYSKNQLLLNSVLLIRDRFLVFWYDIDYISTYRKSYLTEVKVLLKGIKTNVFTINSKDSVNDFFNHDNIGIILSDSLYQNSQ